MTVIREYGNIIFECDACIETFETDTDDFHTAYEQVKKLGWKAVKLDSGEWEHRCSDCEDKE
jgi:hypothetical protein